MKSNVKHIIFDVDGVLINSIGTNGGFLWLENIEVDLGISVHDISNKFFKKYWARIGSGKMDTLVALNEFLNLVDSDITPEVFLNYWHEKDSNINSHVLSSVFELNEKGYELYIGTNQEQYRVKHIQNILNKDKVFNEIFASGLIGFEKPQKEFFIEVQEQIGCKSDEILFIDDSNENIKTAISLGWHGFHYKTFEEYEEIVLQNL